MIKTFDMTPLRDAGKNTGGASSFLYRKMKGTPSNLFNVTLEEVLRGSEGHDQNLQGDPKSRMTQGDAYRSPMNMTLSPRHYCEVTFPFVTSENKDNQKVSK